MAESKTESGATREISRFLPRTTLAELPAEVIARTKHLMLDGFGCGLLFARLDWSERAVETLHALNSDAPPVSGPGP